MDSYLSQETISISSLWSIFHWTQWKTSIDTYWGNPTKLWWKQFKPHYARNNGNWHWWQLKVMTSAELIWIHKYLLIYVCFIPFLVVSWQWLMTFTSNEPEQFTLIIYYCQLHLEAISGQNVINDIDVSITYLLLTQKRIYIWAVFVKRK